MASHPFLFLRPLPTLSSLASFSSQFHFSSLPPPSPLSVPSCLYCLISPSILHLLSPLSSDLISVPSPLRSSCFLRSHLFPSPHSPFPYLYFFWFLLMQQFLLCPNQMLHTIKGKCQVQMLHTRRERSKYTLFTERKDGMI